MIKINLALVEITTFMFGIMPYVYARTQDYMKGYKLGIKDGKTEKKLW
jgi:hypothetical protein